MGGSVAPESEYRQSDDHIGVTKLGRIRRRVLAYKRDREQPAGERHSGRGGEGAGELGWLEEAVVDRGDAREDVGEEGVQPVTSEAQELWEERKGGGGDKGGGGEEEWLI